MELMRWAAMFLMFYIGDHFTEVYYMDLGMNGSANRIYQLIRQQVTIKINGIKLRFDEDIKLLKARRSCRDGTNYMGRVPEILSTIEKESECGDRRGPLYPVSPNSKYFADYDGNYTREEARKLCDENQLVLAEIDTVQDHRSLQDFVNRQISVKAVDVGELKYFIGINDLADEGVYVRGDGNDLTFQTYHATKPTDDEEKDCTTLGKETLEGPVGMSDEDCNKKLHVICMYRGNSVCSQNTSEFMEFDNDQCTERGLEPFVTLSNEKYFVSNFQLPWKNALDYCKVRGMVLFDIDDMVIQQRFFNNLLDWERKMNVHVPNLSYWTTGKCQGAQMNAEIGKQRNMISLVANDSLYNEIHQLGNKNMGNARYQNGYGSDLCSSFSLESKPNSTLYMRNANCAVPTYFICVKTVSESEESGVE